MKSSVLGLFSLALLGFVCAQKAPSDDSESSLTTAPFNNGRTRTRTTRETESNNGNGNGNGNDNGNDNNNDNSDATNSLPAVNTSMTNTTSGTLGPKPTVMTGSGGLKPEASKNRQSHIFTSVSLLLGSLVLVALWQ